MARTTPGVSGLLDRLEYHIKDVFIPVVIGKLHVSEELRKIFSPPARMGGPWLQKPTNGTNETGSKFKANSKIQMKQPGRARSGSTQK